MWLWLAAILLVVFEVVAILDLWVSGSHFVGLILKIKEEETDQQQTNFLCFLSSVLQSSDPIFRGCELEVGGKLVMAPKKSKGKGKGKQPAPKGPAPKEPVPAMPVSSDDEAEDLVNAVILQKLETLVKKRGGPVAQPWLSSNQSFQAQVLAGLAVLQDDGGDAVLVLPAVGDSDSGTGGHPASRNVSISDGGLFWDNDSRR